MATLELQSIDNYCIDAIDDEMDFSDPDNTGDWDGLDIIVNHDNLITNESIAQSRSIIQTYRKECWHCIRCNTINNVRHCIRKHGSKCIGCKTEYYIECQTPTIMHSEYHSNDKLFQLQMEQMWECESCLMINDKANEKCIECEKQSPMVVIRRQIEKFTKEQKAKYLIRGFVRLHEYYLEMKNIPYVLFTLIRNYYIIDYIKEGWIIGNIKCMSIIKASNLEVGDKLDHRLCSKFEIAEVKELIKFANGECKFRLWYDGRARTVWHDYNNNRLKFAEAGAISARPAHRLIDI